MSDSNGVNKDENFQVTEEQVLIQKDKSIKGANKRLIFNILSAFFTFLAIFYTNDLKLLSTTILIFTIPLYLDVNDMIIYNKSDKMVNSITNFLLSSVSVIIVMLLMLNFYDEKLLLSHKDWYNYFMIVPLGIVLIFSIYRCITIRSNVNEHIALAVVSEKAKQSFEKKLNFKEDMKSERKNQFKEFVSTKK